MKTLSTTTARALLADRTFDIEFNGYLSNHAKHAIIALDRLEAPEPRVQGYWDEYTHLTPYSLSLHKVENDWLTVKPVSETEWKELRGKKEKWQEQVAFMSQQLDSKYGGVTTALVQQYAPDLLSGVAGALTHGIIHLGWGIDADSPWMILEGLAYLNFCHIGVDPVGLKRNKHIEISPMDSFVRVAKSFETDDLQKTWVDRAKAAYDENFHAELVPAGFQWQVAKVLHEVHPVATDLPSWVDNTEIEKLWEDMYFTTVWLYLATRDQQDGHGNFLVLHLMTSLWGLEKVCRVIDSEKITRDAIAQFYACVVCLLATSSYPKTAALEGIKAEFPVSQCDDGFDWDPVVTRGIAETEEHNIKLVYVMRELWRRYGEWSGFSEAAESFTVTPNIGPTSTAFVADK